MSKANKDVKFSLKVMVNKERTKVLFAEVDSSFADVLLSFLTLPLGMIVRILKKHYGDEAPVFGSLNSLYNGLLNLDSGHFWTKGAKSILLHPRSSYDNECNKLNLNISDPPPLEYFVCEKRCGIYSRIESVSMFHDSIIITCRICKRYGMRLQEEQKDPHSQTAKSNVGVFTMKTSTLLITDDLQIHSNITGLIQFFSVLGSAATDKADEIVHTTFGYAEVMDLLKASLFSVTPLSDVILDKTRQMSSATRRCYQEGIGNAPADDTNSKSMNLKLILRKSTKKLLYAVAEGDFVEFLFSLLIIPLGGVECLLSNNISIKSIDNLYKSASDFIESKCFKNHDAKSRLINPTIPHGYISEKHILPLTQECLPDDTRSFWSKSSVKFPRGQGIYLKGPQTYQVTDDLTVTPICNFSFFSSFSELNIPLSDLEVMEVIIGLKEALSILEASLTSTSVLTDVLLNHTSNKQPKPEP